MKQANRWYIPILLALAGLVLTPATPARAQLYVDPWDTSWLPDNRNKERALDRALNDLLGETGLHGQGKTIRVNAQRHGVNPAFALAMFRKEAGFAKPGTLAHSNKNPANIIATGECWGKSKGTRCQGFYGEVSTDGRFGRYASMADGITAFFVLMENEYAGMPLYDLISRACPPVECDVPRYVALMEQWLTEYQAQLIGALYAPIEFEGTVLDDRTTAFWRRGPAEYWHQSEGGHAGHMWWTRNNRENAENAGRWSLELDRPGTYVFYAYIPPLHATTRQGHYTIYCAGQAQQTTIDQFAHRNQWVSLGRVRCAATGDEYVELSDATGEPPFEYEIAFDAIRVLGPHDGDPDKITPQLPTRAPSTEIRPTHDLDAPQAPEDSERPVLLARLWNMGRQLCPFCCGSGILLLVLGLLALVVWGRRPFDSIPL